MRDRNEDLLVLFGEELESYETRVTGSEILMRKALSIWSDLRAYKIREKDICTRVQNGSLMFRREGQVRVELGLFVPIHRKERGDK